MSRLINETLIIGVHMFVLTWCESSRMAHFHQLQYHGIRVGQKLQGLCVVAIGCFATTNPISTSQIYTTSRFATLKSTSQWQQPEMLVQCMQKLCHRVRVIFQDCYTLKCNRIPFLSVRNSKVSIELTNVLHGQRAMQ